MISETTLTFIKSIWEALVWVLLWVLLWTYSILAGHQVILLDILLVLVVATIYGQSERRYVLAQLSLPKGKASSLRRELVSGAFFLVCVAVWAYMRPTGWPEISTLLYTLAGGRIAYLFIASIFTPRPRKI